MRFAITPNHSKKAAEQAREIAKVLSAHKGEIVSGADLTREEIAGCDMVIAVGGDGTIIHKAKLAAELDKPVLGVNAGTLGFTAGLERDELSLLPRLLTGDYREERRFMLSATLYGKGKTSSYCALNDAVVSGESTSIINYVMALGENSGSHCRADGFIVATPTGSTAYSLSAGGPVIQPDMSCLIYTPVCPHSLFNRSVIFGGDTRLTVTLPQNRRRVFLTVDGEPPIPLRAGDKLVFCRSKTAARFVRLGKKNFYDVLSRKIAGI